jgi:hypothetical protein
MEPFYLYQDLTGCLKIDLKKGSGEKNASYFHGWGFFIERLVSDDRFRKYRDAGLLQEVTDERMLSIDGNSL